LIQQQQQQQQPKQQQKPVQNNAAQELPVGWAAIQDPASGMTYYANQSTGETTWEKPASPQQLNPVQPAPQASQQPGFTGTNGHVANQQHAHSQQQAYQQASKKTSPVGSGNINGSAKLVAKYGDGFVTSSSHPELAEQYGNVGTSNPYTGGQRPGTAATPVIKKGQKAPTSGNFDPSNPPSLSPELQPIADSLLNFLNVLSVCELSGSEKKQFAEIQKGVGVVIKKLSRDQVDECVTQKIQHIVAALGNKDYASAGAAQTSLVNSDWREHKDWLKGMKFLIQLGSRRQI